MNYIYIKMGNKVSIGNLELRQFNSFNEAWEFAHQLNRLIQSKVFTQGGTWILD